MGTPSHAAGSVRRFLGVMIVTAFLAGLAARHYGEDVTHWLDRVPATASGWQVIGWLFGGPPLFLAGLAWLDRHRLDADQLRSRANLYGMLMGLGGFVVPAIANGSYDLYGPGVEIGNPLAFGWACGSVANLGALLFATALGMTRASVGTPGPATAVTLRFVEVGWAVLLVGSLFFAAYGAQLGFVY